jgi:hypothetical protein
MKKTNPPRILLEHHLKTLRLSVFLREHRKIATQCASDKCDYETYLVPVAERGILKKYTPAINPHLEKY